MAGVKTAPYGSWISPITSDKVIKESRSLKDVRTDPFHEDKVYWCEMRPEEEGRYVVCSKTEGDSDLVSITPEDYSCRTRVHEYGGGAFFVYNKHLYFSNFSDQRMYVQKVKDKESHQDDPVPLTPEGKDWRYADGVMVSKKHIVCVREDHEVLNTGAKEAENTLVSIDCKTQEQSVLVSGANFYSTPRVSQKGVVAWIQWNHSNMPWDSTELWIAELSHKCDSLKEGTLRKVAGGEGISVMLNSWSPSDQLLYISDQTNWWNLYRLDGDKETNILPQDKEIGGPAWEFGASPYACIPNSSGDILVTQEEGLAILKPSGELCSVDTGYTYHSNLHFSCNGKVVYMIVGSAKRFPKIIKLELDTGKVTILRESNVVDIHNGYYSEPTQISWPTTNGATSYGFFYPPTNKDYQGPVDGKPQLLVKVHGGPTSACQSVLELKKQFFTSRGFAILDVNYRGSTGFGRKYRDALKKNWGVSDIEDCCEGAKFLADNGKVDPKCMAIDGGSAGGFVTLAALTFHKVLNAGASFYGICDLEALAQETHKFESHYVDGLIGPYPEDRLVYQDRSPIHHVDQLDCALAIFQGDEDEVVPPNQALKMFNAVKEKGKPVAYKLFEGEQHGFRKSENIKFCLDGEFYFYSQVFGFDAPGIDVDLEIFNLDKK